MHGGFGEIMVLMAAMLGGGSLGNDMIDYVPTAMYWQFQGVEVKPAEMLKQFEDEATVPADAQRQIDNLASSSPKVREQASDALRKMGPVVKPLLEKAGESTNEEVAVRAKALVLDMNQKVQAGAIRRLMAIRALGELKDKSAVDALNKLGKSDRLFEADYAKQALAKIEGKPAARAGVDPAKRKEDLWLLPKESGLVAQMTITPGAPVDFKAMLQPMAPMMGGDASAIDEMVGDVVEKVLDVAERAGNLRIDSVTVGLNENPEAGVVVVLRGLYDPKAVAAAFQAMNPNMAVKQVDGVDVIELDNNEAFLVLLDPQRAIFIGGERRFPKPIEAMVAAGKKGKGALEENKELSALIQTVDVTAPIWGAMVMNEHYRQAPNSQPFDTVTLVAARNNGVGQFTVVAQGKDEQAVGESVNKINAEIAKAKEEFARQGFMPIPIRQPMQKLLDSIKLENDGGKATLQWELPGDGLGMMGGMMFMAMPRRHHAQPMPAAQIEAVPPVQVDE